MQIGILGANYKTMDIRLREMVAKAWKNILEKLSLKGYVLLSTCNRQEIYFSGDDLAKIHEEFFGHLRKEICEEFEPFLYSYFGMDAFFHLAKVTTGLDSAILGESEIQGQVKRAYLECSDQFPLCSSLHYLFQKCLQLGKWMRTESWVLPKMPSLASEIDRLIQVLTGEENPSIFFLGNSKINQNLMGYFQKKEWNQLALCSRHPFHDIPWEDLERWQEFDIVITASKDANFVIQKKSSSLKTKMLFDLGVPRNIHPSLERDPKLHFFNLENLEKLFKKNNRRYYNNVQLCESEIKNKVNKYYLIYKNKQCVSSY